jgi:sugar phosphate isomerase/epimerase
MGYTDILSIQLYTLRSLGDLERVLDTVQQAGYGHVETIGSHLDDAENVHAKLEARGLKVSSSHVSLAAVRERPDQVIQACHTLDLDQLFMPAVPSEERESDAPYWRALGRELGEIAQRMHEQGIAFGYHNHHWELIPKEGAKTALDLIFEAAGDSPLAWQADVAWLVRGGADPKDWMHRYRDRIISAHVKDIAPQGQNLDQDGWADVGAGILDWRDLWQAARAAGARWMVVEHDKPADPAETARASYTFISRMEG